MGKVARPRLVWKKNGDVIGREPRPLKLAHDILCLGARRYDTYDCFTVCHCFLRCAYSSAISSSLCTVSPPPVRRARDAMNVLSSWLLTGPRSVTTPFSVTI